MGILSGTEESDVEHGSRFATAIHHLRRFGKTAMFNTVIGIAALSGGEPNAHAGGNQKQVEKQNVCPNFPQTVEPGKKYDVMVNPPDLPVKMSFSPYYIENAKSQAKWRDGRMKTLSGITLVKTQQGFHIETPKNVRGGQYRIVVGKQIFLFNVPIRHTDLGEEVSGQSHSVERGSTQTILIPKGAEVHVNMLRVKGGVKKVEKCTLGKKDGSKVLDAESLKEGFPTRIPTIIRDGDTLKVQIGKDLQTGDSVTIYVNGKPHALGLRDVWKQREFVMKSNQDEIHCPLYPYNWPIKIKTSCKRNATYQTLGSAVGSKTICKGEFEAERTENGFTIRRLSNNYDAVIVRRGLRIRQARPGDHAGYQNVFFFDKKKDVKQ